MISPSNIIGKKGLVMISTGLLILLPSFYFIIVTQYQNYPSLSITLIVLLAFFIAWLIMTLGAQLDNTKRQQQRELDLLIQRVLTDHPHHGLTAITLNEIKKIFFIESAKIISAKKEDPHALKIKIPARRNSLYLSLGNKKDGLPWRTYEIRALQLLVDSLGATLSLEIEKIMAKNGLENLQNKVIHNSRMLENLKVSLNKREWEHTQKFDELAHELKNPIALLSFSVQESDQTDNNRDQKLIVSEINWMKKYVDHVLDLARLRAQKTRIKNKYINLFDLARDAIYEVRNIVIDKKIHLTPVKTSKNIFADEHLVYSSIRNLLVVATNLSAKDIDIKISTDKNKARLSIQFSLALDKAIVAKDFLDKNQVSHEQRKSGLTGLELEIARSVLVKYGGNVLVNSESLNLIKIEIDFPLKKRQRVASP